MSNMHADPCLWWKISQSTSKSNLFILTLLTAGLITIQILRNQGCRRQATSLPEPRLVKGPRTWPGIRSVERSTHAHCLAHSSRSLQMLGRYPLTEWQDPHTYTISALLQSELGVGSLFHTPVSLVRLSSIYVFFLTWWANLRNVDVWESKKQVNERNEFTLGNRRWELQTRWTLRGPH